jgi:hypothetical protein
MEYLLFLPLFGPGLALVFWLMADQDFTVFDRTVLGLGVSLAFYPIFLLLFHIAGLPVNAPVIGALVAVSWLGLLWQLLPHLRKLSSTVRQPLALKLEATTLAWLFLAIVLALSAYVRVAVVKDLKIPMWADSYHHTMISQLMIDNNGLFSSWLPYAPLKTFTYHFGFHSLVAGYHWLTGVAMPRSVIITGQMINVVVVLGCYLLAKYLTGKEWAGNVAALFVGLISPMPAYYFNWGRYTQLTGLAVLPIAMVLLVYLLNQKTVNRGVIFLTGFTIAGLGLSHYAVFVFFLLFGGIFSLYKFIETRANKPRWRELVLKLGLVGVIGGVLSGPWLGNLLQGRSFFIAAKIIERGANNTDIQAHNIIGSPTFFLGAHWYVLTLLAFGWAIWRREKWVILTAIWAVSLLLLANPYYVRLPGTGIINNFAVFISLFLPISVLLGNLAADGITGMQRWYPWTVGVAVVLLLVLGVRGATFRLAALQPNRQLVTEQDLQAMEWISQNTTKDAKFLVNDFLAYGNSTMVGSDAGWWLPLLANRQTNLPPLNYIKESAITSDYFDELRRFQQQTTMDRLLTEQGWQTLKEAGITHIYIGQQTEGPVWYTEEEPLDAQQLKASPYYQLTYHHDKVSILAVRQELP